jgi:hypothetical protein
MRLTKNKKGPGVRTFWSVLDDSFLINFFDASDERGFYLCSHGANVDDLRDHVG